MKGRLESEEKYKFKNFYINSNNGNCYCSIFYNKSKENRKRI